MTTRSLCIHGHFYQPSREDPITGLIPNEYGAAPFKNWNERILAECYRPNSELGNYEHISFNLGPSLSSWLEDYDPVTYRNILRQDRENVRRYGVGNAMAQAYNHTILPLASRVDKITQVKWGIADFEHRFGRKPQGMWLPETAADIETLCVLADLGLEFTILAPWQAAIDSLDPTEPYRVALPEGKSITVFFYHQELSARISFDPLATINADSFVYNEVSPRFHGDKSWQNQPQLILIASDGELYGHHQQLRDRFLAHLVDGACHDQGITTTYLARWLKEYPPRKVIDIHEKTSWSCHHGVLRWMDNCGCTPGDGRWKYYLRRALDRLAVNLDGLYESSVSLYQIDPWALRDNFIHVLLGECSPADLINAAAGRFLPQEIIRNIYLLLKAQRERQRMFTSCGWFFDDFGRIEPKNNVAYAAHAVWLAYLATGINLSPHVLDDLHHVVSQRSKIRGDSVFIRQLRRAKDTLE